MTDYHRLKPYSDPSLRRQHYGKIEPLDYERKAMSWPWTIGLALFLGAVAFWAAVR